MKQPSSSYSNFPSHFTSMKKEEHTSCGRMEQLSGATSDREMFGLTLAQVEFWQLEMPGRQLPSLQFIMEIFLTSIHYLVDTDKFAKFTTHRFLTYFKDFSTFLKVFLYREMKNRHSLLYHKHTFNPAP